MNYDTPIMQVGIGPVTVAGLRKAKLRTVGDVLERVPNHYYLPYITPVRELQNGKWQISRGVIRRTERCGRGSGRLGPVEVVIEDSTGKIVCRWYGQVFKPLRQGHEIIVWGKVTNGIMSHPEFTTDVASFSIGSVAGGHYGVHTASVRSTLNVIFADVGLRANEWVGYCYQLHRPRTHDDYTTAVEALKFKELELLQVAKRVQRTAASVVVSPTIAAVDTVEKRKVTKYFPFVFTEDQQAACEQINHDLELSRPMTRLLHGEVASGKSAVAYWAAIRLLRAGHKTLIVSPTTILAQQHYENLLKLVSPSKVYNYKAGGPYPSDERVIIGTHAIINRSRLLCDTSLVVIDEQHKFGVAQRAKVQKCGTPPNLLYMSATPIPRTLAMTVFGDLDVSVIKQMPGKRGSVSTRWVIEDEYDAVVSCRLHAAASRGEQAYIVYPRIRTNKEDLDGAKAGYVRAATEFNGPNCHVGLLTGSMSHNEKQTTMRLFNEGYFSVLVSTVIAEVGVDNHNATTMVVMGADRFGLSQLHQLRGRISRSSRDAVCYLVADTANQNSIARLRVMEACNDGFELAEQDLRLRGPGDMFSLRQHGLPPFKFADLAEDYEMFKNAAAAASNIVAALHEPRFAEIRDMLRIKYPKLNLAGVA